MTTQQQQKKQPETKNKKTATAARQQFSPQQTAGQSRHECQDSSKTVPHKPCNLQLLRLTEPEADCSGKKQTRVVEVRKGQSLRRNATPVLIAPGGKFQITANSEVNGQPRRIDVTIGTQVDCSASIHPLAKWKDSKSEASKVGKTEALSFYRQPLPGDKSSCGFFAMLNAAFGHKPIPYPISANSCGLPKPAGSGSVQSLNAVVEVFPGDLYSAELSFPAFLKPDALDYSKATEKWTSTRDRDKEKINEAGKEADKYYKSEQQFFHEIGASKAEFRDFAESQTKRKLGYVDSNPEGLEIKVSQIDGNRTLDANVDEIVKLIRLIRNAEYRFKQFNDWFESFQVGLGVSFKAECQFLVLKLNAKWGYTEHTDDRVFLLCSGSADIDIIKASLKGSFGFRSGGLCDLLLVLKGEGTLGITVEGFIKQTPDDSAKGEVKPRGELKISVSVEGTLLWAAKAEGKVEVTFKADTEELHILSDKGILSGKIVVSREPVEFSVTASCWLYGATSKVKVRGDPKMANFDF